MAELISLLTILTPILKGITSGVGSQIGQSFFTQIKDSFKPSIAKKVEKAYLMASNKQLDLDEEIESQIHIFEKDEYYDQLIYGFSLVDGEDLTPYHKNISKLFLIEAFKDEKLKDEIFKVIIDSIKQDTIKAKLNTEILKDRFIGTLKDFSHDRFMSEIDFNDFPKYYIPRKINLDRDWFSENKINSFNELFTYCKNSQQNKITPIRALIIADGGIGKSIYLQQLSKECADSKRFHPVYISLRDLTASDVVKDYIERRHPELKKFDILEYDQLFLFLDGFDEIGDSAAAIKQMGDLCRTYSQTHILLTSRRNSFSNQLPNFNESFIFTLTNITKEDIESYILLAYSLYEIDTDRFFKEVQDNDFANLLYSPFYLSVLIDCYIENNNSLRISKKELIDNLITKRREKDKEKRPDLNLDKASTKLKIIQLGSKFALTQALMNQRNLSDNDTAKLFDADFDLAIYSLPIRKGSLIEGKQQWEFEHNIFLEHLVSDILKDLGLDQTLEYATSNNKVKSKWKDIITHLLGILDNRNTLEKILYDNLTNWLIENDSEVLLNVEESHLDQDIRSKIFVDIYKTKQKKTTWIDRNKINLQQMALFGETRENVHLLFNDIINKKNHYRQRINASLIFQHFELNDFSQIEIEKMSQKYADVICNISVDVNENSEDILYYLIYNFPFKSEKDIDQIIRKFATISSSKIISSLLHLISNNNLEDKYIEILIIWIEKRYDQHIIGNMGIGTSLNRCLLKLKTSLSYDTLFMSLDQADLYDYFRQYESGNLSYIIKNSLPYYSFNILKSLINLIINKHIAYSPDDWRIFDSFFKNKNIRKDAIRLILSNLVFNQNENTNNWDYTCILAHIIDQEDLASIFTKIDNRDFYICLNNNTIKQDIKDLLLTYLKNSFNFTPPVYENKQNIWNERRRREFDILFEKEAFITTCLNVFDELNVTIINPSVLLSDRYRDNGKYWNLSVLYFLEWFKEGVEVKRSDVEEWFANEPEYFDYYLNGRIYNRIPDPIKKEKNKELTDSQIKFIKEFYDKYIQATDFSVEIDRNNKDSISCSEYAIILITYMKKLNFDCPDNKLCEMIGNLCCKFDFITNKIKDKALLNKTILQNLSNYKEFADSRTYQQCKYIISNNSTADIDSIILEIIKDSGFDEYQKNEIIAVCIEHNKLINDIINLYSYLTQSQILEMCNVLIQKNYSNKAKVHSLLHQIIEKPGDDKIKLAAITLLISQQDIKALGLLVNYSKEHNTIALHDPFNNSSLNVRVPENYLQYEYMGALPLLMELLELSLKPTTTPKNAGRNKIESNLTHLALLSEDNYIEVVMTLEQFIRDNKSEDTDAESINFIIERINDLHQEKQSKQYSFKEAKAICDNII